MTFEEYWWIGVCANPNMARDVLLKQIAESAWNAGAKAEREECAKVCEGQIDSFEANRGYGPEICAEAIRARSNVDVTGPRLRGSGGQQGSTAQSPSSGD